MRYSYYIFNGFSKAFDTINHDILVQKRRHYGIANSALDIIQNYLSNRKQYVEIENTKSRLWDITTCVPQGSILGPLIFIIYINDIIKASDLFNYIMYADYNTIITSV